MARERIAGPIEGGSAEDRREDNGTSAPAIRLKPRAPVPLDALAVVEKLMRDPSLRGNERGKEKLRLLHTNALALDQLLAMVAVRVSPRVVR